MKVWVVVAVSSRVRVLLKLDWVVQVHGKWRMSGTMGRRVRKKRGRLL